MSCRSAIYAVNTSTATIPEGGTYQPNTIIRRFGQCCQMANNAMELNGQGYYDVAVTATVIGTVAGNVTMTVYQDGLSGRGGGSRNECYTDHQGCWRYRHAWNKWNCAVILRQEQLDTYCCNRRSSRNWKQSCYRCYKAVREQMFLREL